MDHLEERRRPGTELEGYTVRDDYGQRIGKVQSVCPDEGGEPEFFLVSLGFFVESYALVPADIANVLRELAFVEVAASREKVVAESGPVFADRRVSEERKELARAHYGLRPMTDLHPAGREPVRPAGENRLRSSGHDDR